MITSVAESYFRDLDIVIVNNIRNLAFNFANGFSYMTMVRSGAEICYDVYYRYIVGMGMQ